MMSWIDHRDDLRAYKLVEIGIGHVGKILQTKWYCCQILASLLASWRAAASKGMAPLETRQSLANWQAAGEPKKKN